MKSEGVGSRIWFIPDGYLPVNPVPTELPSHEAVCLLNVGDQPAHVDVTIYFEDREPLTGIKAIVGPQRCLHLRLDKPEMLGGIKIPSGVPYALKVESDQRVIVQHSRLDVTQPNLALFTTMGYPVE